MSVPALDRYTMSGSGDIISVGSAAFITSKLSISRSSSMMTMSLLHPRAPPVLEAAMR